MTRKIAALLRKDFLIERSYKFPFFLNVFSVAAAILTYFFIDKLFAGAFAPTLDEFGGSYFAYVLLSMACYSYIGTGLGSFSGRIRQEQVQGTLETLLVTPTPVAALLSAIGLWSIIWATIDAALYIAAGAFLFNIDFGAARLSTVSIVLLLTIACFSSLGIISASFVLIFKRGNPVAWLINTLEGVIGGVFFPIAVLPVWLRILAQCLPITHAIRAMQLAVFRGATLRDVKTEIAALSLFTLVLLPLSLRLFRLALNRARRTGTLHQS